ncbi:hypothetical protein J437_LFUL016406 [Ladona fulva]|uniref:ZAD domain-containing protein n=1 Tax=Ladona fulva TaxID=123851 RepID=A0A8K0P5B6_LADFU|nr:hypothetical protein J437_LFUL016406 [Ladona fulva]
MCVEELRGKHCSVSCATIPHELGLNMEIKGSCRLCLAKEGEFYKLFNASNGDCTLADELNRLLDFKIENSGDLPDAICANCYNINSFFKEFRRDCARVKDRLLRLVEATDTRVSVKLEKTDDCEDGLEDGTSRISTTLNSQQSHPSFVENLRSNFRDAIVSGADRATNDVPSQSLETKGKKRRNESSENTIHTQDRVIVQEPLLALVKSEYISEEEEFDARYGQASDSENDSNQFNAYPATLSACNSRNSEILGNSVSKPSNVGASTSLDLNAKGSSDNLYEGSLSPRRKRQRIMVEGNDSGEHTRSSIIQEEIHHRVKEEEIEIFDHPEEDEFDHTEEDSIEKDDYSSDPVESSSSVDPDELEISSSSSLSSDDSEEDTEMLLCLALLL